MARTAVNTTDPAEVLRALGMAWSSYELYPNPMQQESFRTAVARLQHWQDQALTYEIGAGRILCGGAEVEFRQGATERLALRLFVHDVDSFEMIGAPSAADLNHFFTQLARDEGDVLRTGGIARELESAGVASIGIIQRGILSEQDTIWSADLASKEKAGEGEEGNEPEIVGLVNAGASAETIAAAVIKAASGDADKIASVFLKSYQVVYQIAELVEADVSTNLEKMLAAYRQAPSDKSPLVIFVEAYFLLPQVAQAKILETFLSNSEQLAYRLLIDQFAGLDLVEIAQFLPPDSHEKLSEYIRDVVDADEGSAEELLPLIRSAQEVEQMRTDLAGRVAQMLHEFDTLPGPGIDVRETLREELSPDSVAETGLAVVKALFECETRSERFDRLVKTWLASLTGLIQSRQLDRALMTLEAGIEVPHSGFRHNALEEALAALTATNIELLVDLYQDGSTQAETIRLVTSFGTPALDRLVTRLAIEESPARRRGLIGLISEAGKENPQPILAHLKDSRWYLVRNLISVVAKIGAASAMSQLVALTQHDDERVVSEALRAISVLNPEDSLTHLIRCLDNPGPRIQETARILLRTNMSPALENSLRDAMLEKHSSNEAREWMAEILHERQTSEGRKVLVELAGLRNSLRPAKRSARRAARRALEQAA
jgi:HEAT repeat protein